jgi:hypothetical protein
MVDDEGAEQARERRSDGVHARRSLDLTRDLLSDLGQ